MKDPLIGPVNENCVMQPVTQAGDRVFLLEPPEGLLRLCGGHSALFQFIYGLQKHRKVLVVVTAPENSELFPDRHHGAPYQKDPFPVVYDSVADTAELPAYGAVQIRDSGYLAPEIE